MPELPDVVAFAGYLDSTSLNKKIVHTSITDERVLKGVSRQKLQRTLKGSRLEKTSRHGKFLFVQLERDGWLLLHFGMTGFLAYYKNEADSPEHARLVLEFDNGFHLAYDSQRMLGEVGLVDDIGDFVKERGMGPDAMSEELDRSEFEGMLKGRTGMIKPTLMNQGIIAGIGNVYSDEILFQAGIHPETRVNTLSEDDVKKLYRVMRRVLRVTSKKQAKVERMPRGYILPHREEGATCPRCGGKVRKVTVSGRSAYYCPKCQKKR